MKIASSVSPSVSSNTSTIKLPCAFGGADEVRELLSESIHETLTELLGRRVRESVYDYLERKHSVARNEIPEHLDELFNLLEQYFGVRGMNVIGRAIAKRICLKMNWEFTPIPKFEFADYVRTIKARIAQDTASGARP